MIRLAAPILAMASLAPVQAWAYGGIGCTDLPEYDRAQGALQGMTGACDMTIAQARQIVAAHDGPAVVDAPVQRHRHRHRIVRP